MGRFANLADKPKASPISPAKPSEPYDEMAVTPSMSVRTASKSNSRAGRKAIAAYFSPEMSLAMHVCARKHSLSLQDLMTEAFDDVLRKYGKSPLGE
jgi:hypothetical protein